MDYNFRRPHKFAGRTLDKQSDNEHSLTIQIKTIQIKRLTEQLVTKAGRHVLAKAG